MIFNMARYTAGGAWTRKSTAAAFTKGIMSFTLPSKPKMVYASLDDDDTFMHKRMTYFLDNSGTGVCYRQTGTSSVSWSTATWSWNETTKVFTIQVHSTSNSGTGSWFATGG